MFTESLPGIWLKKKSTGEILAEENPRGNFG
jgi:hypothetical protein